MTEFNWWQVGGYTLLCLWMIRILWLVWDADMGDDE